MKPSPGPNSCAHGRTYAALFLLLASAVSLRAADQVEDAAARARLPLYQTIPAATAAELTPASGQPAAASLRNWTVSHGDAGSRRY